MPSRSHLRFKIIGEELGRKGLLGSWKVAPIVRVGSTRAVFKVYLDSVDPLRQMCFALKVNLRESTLNDRAGNQLRSIKHPLIKRFVLEEHPLSEKLSLPVPCWAATWIDGVTVLQGVAMGALHTTVGSHFVLNTVPQTIRALWNTIKDPTDLSRGFLLGHELDNVMYGTPMRSPWSMNDDSFSKRVVFVDARDDGLYFDESERERVIAAYVHSVLKEAGFV